MTPILEIIKGRRSIRRFQRKVIEDEKIRQILEAAIWAPSAGNLQPWVFIVVRDPKTIEKIKAVSPGMFDLPAAIVAVCRDMKIAEKSGNPILSIFDISMAAQNILLMAYELGIGSCPVKSFSQRAVQVLLDLPDHILPELLITLGYPAEKPSPRHRKRDVIFFERYGEYGGGLHEGS
jgi:nitroreductase